MRTARIVTLLLAALWCGPAARGLEIPLVVPERAGVDRVDNAVNGGVPLPQGTCKDVDKFWLADANGSPVQAQFVVRERWLTDDSVRFMTVHFRTDVKAGQTARFTVRDDAAPKLPGPPLPPVVVEARGDAVTVNTQTVRFTVSKGPWHLFDTVEAGGKAAIKAPGEVVFKAEYGRTPIENKMAKPPALGAPADATAVVKSITVEENGPARAVVLVTGAFQQEGADKLDFQARYYALAGSAAVRVVFTVVNRQGASFDSFVGLRQLGFRLQLADAGPQYRYALGSSQGQDIEGAVHGGQRVAMLQPTSIAYVVSGQSQATGPCKEIDTRRVGWLSLDGKSQALTVGVRWFWQLHPKGLEAAGDGSVGVWLVPLQGEKAAVPAGEYSEPLTRIDLYTGGARTHDLLFAFHAPAGAADDRARAMAVVSPLFAACQPQWYCQKTLAFDRICDISLDNYPAELRPLVQEYENATDLSFATVMAYMNGSPQKDVKVKFCLPSVLKDKDGKPLETTYVSGQKVEEYGWMSFGSHCEYKDYCTENDALNSRWDGNYYDFPRACLIRFVRSGAWEFFDAAEAAAMHLADIDICHWHPTNQALNGIEHTCPDRGHFRQWWGGEPFGVSGNVDSAKSQSLYELYDLTGDGWYRDVGLLAGDYLTAHGGSALRAQGNRITGLFLAWRASRDAKYKAVWEKQAKATTALGVGRGGQKAWDQFWMYGLAAEGLYNCFKTVGDLEAAKATVLAADSLMYCDVNKTMGKSQRGEYNGLAGFTLAVPGYAYELTGEGKYLKYGLERLAVAATHKVNRSKTFAQQFRISPQFLYYISGDYQPPKPVIGDKQAADPVAPVVKAFAASQSADSEKQ
ncbi:MAG: hypothetical protein BIFFINMI_00817 [Phycisphaerae bacterium]|nr:hypothetical protein [Phycisphaerae bacterium]